LPEYGAVFVPTNRSAWRILRQQNVLQAGWVHVGECGSCVPDREQEVRYVFRLLQTPAVEVVPPTKGSDETLADEALEFERLEVCSFSIPRTSLRSSDSLMSSD
jgi:hypothetical protein